MTFTKHTQSEGHEVVEGRDLVDLKAKLREEEERLAAVRKVSAGFPPDEK